MFPAFCCLLLDNKTTIIYNEFNNKKKDICYLLLDKRAIIGYNELNNNNNMIISIIYIISIILGAAYLLDKEVERQDKKIKSLRHRKNGQFKRKISIKQGSETIGNFWM